MAKIKKITALEVLDSRGFPTVYAKLETESGAYGEALVPSGTSSGAHEACELRDSDPKRYMGKGALKAVRNVNNAIAKKLKGQNLAQGKVDAMMLSLDGTENKTKLGGNAILAVSMAAAGALAKTKRVPLYRSIREAKNYTLPRLLFNVLNGGAHGDSGFAVQEFKIVPLKTNSVRETLRVGAEIFHVLREMLAKKEMSIGVGYEGGFAPRLGSSENALKILVEAIKKAGYKPGSEVAIALDVAATEFYKGDSYLFEGKSLTAEELEAVYASWLRRFPIVSIEDPFAEDDWDSWVAFTAKFGEGVQVVGDDLTVTNPKRLREAIMRKACNALIIKPNQIGSLSETLEVIDIAKAAGFGTIMSHRSGDTEDTSIADIAVATSCGQMKTGSLSRGERTAKFNRLLVIENELGKKAKLGRPKYI